MQLFKNYKSIAIVLILFAAAWGAYIFLSSDTGEVLLVSENAGGAIAAGKEVLVLLEELKGLQLNDAIFTSPAFRSLKDFRKEIKPEPVGRPNPFAPLGSTPPPR